MVSREHGLAFGVCRTAELGHAPGSFTPVPEDTDENDHEEGNDHTCNTFEDTSGPRGFRSAASI